MPRKTTPSSVMYAELKRLGMSNRDAAAALLNTQLTFDGQPLQARINESSQLSRRIVHTEPGEIPRGLFNSFHLSCPRIARAVIDEQSIERYHGDPDEAATGLLRSLAGAPSEKMLAALSERGIDGAVYRNMGSYIAHSDLPDNKDRFTLALMMFIVTGCLGNPRVASITVVDYATEVLGADFQTAQTVISAVAQPTELQTDPLLGLVRMVEGKIKAGAQMHVLNADGTEIGLLPKARHTIADVDADVSRRHARIWREKGTWFIEGLGSTNGTFLVSGVTSEEIVVELPRAARVDGQKTTPVEIAATDILLLGSTTQFMVLPVM